MCLGPRGIFQQLQNTRVFQGVLQDSLFDCCEDQPDIRGISRLGETKREGEKVKNHGAWEVAMLGSCKLTVGTGSSVLDSPG